MLVLSRKVGECIVIDEFIVVTVVRTRSGSVQLGVQAPDHVRVLRQELQASRLPGAQPQHNGQTEADR
jgi:carbon storage regulator